MKYKTLFRLGVRLLGLYFIGMSLSWLAVGLITCAWSALFEFGGPGFGLGPFYALDRILSYAAMCLLGFYLWRAPKWIIDRAIPSNRPYCHECAYELTGLPREGVCPECGTAYRFGRTPHADIDSDVPPAHGQR